MRRDANSDACGQAHVIEPGTGVLHRREMGCHETGQETSNLVSALAPIPDLLVVLASGEIQVCEAKWTESE